MSLPAKYLGVLVKDGYLIPIDVVDAYGTMLRAAEDGDETAREIYRTLPFGLPAEQRLIQDKIGIRMTGDAFRIVLEPGQYPPRFRGKCVEHAQRAAEQGSFCAERLLSYLALTRITYPELELIDRNY